MKRLMIGVVIGAAVVVGGVLAYRHFVTNQVTDKGGMENPFLAEFPQDAELQALDWTQNAMNGDDCFTFSLRREGGTCYGSCDFAPEEAQGQRFQRESAPLSVEEWTAVEGCLRGEKHMPRMEDEDGVTVADETVSRLGVVWKTAENGENSAEFDGKSEDELRTLLQGIFTRTPEKYAPEGSE